MPGIPAPDCPECGNPTDSRLHLEGRGGVHEATPETAVNPGASRAELVAIAKAVGIKYVGVSTTNLALALEPAAAEA